MADQPDQAPAPEVVIHDRALVMHQDHISNLSQR